MVSCRQGDVKHMESNGLDGKLGRERQGGLWAEVLLGVTSSRIFTLPWLHSLPGAALCSLLSASSLPSQGCVHPTGPGSFNFFCVAGCCFSKNNPPARRTVLTHQIRGTEGSS